MERLLFLHQNYICTLSWPPHLVSKYLWCHRLGVQLCYAYGRSPGVLQPFGYSESLNPPAEQSWLLKKAKKNRAGGKLDADMKETCKETARKRMSELLYHISMAMWDKQIMPSMMNYAWGENREEKKTSCITPRDKLMSIWPSGRLRQLKYPQGYLPAFQI